MVKWQEAIALEDNLIKLIMNHLFVSGNKEYPRLSMQELKPLKLWKDVSEGYLQSFGSRKLPKEIRDYWKDRLGLNSGAPLALYIEISKQNPKELIYHQQIFFNAQKHLSTEPSELKKIENVLSLEPFLSHAEYLLRYLSQSSIKLLKEEEKNIEILRKEIIAAADFSLTDIQQRLKDLYAVMTFNGTTTDWLTGILAYHKKVMEQREGNCWIELDEKGTIKHLFSPVLSEKYNTIPKYLKEKPWWHTYYIETLQSIYLGLN